MKIMPVVKKPVQALTIFLIVMLLGLSGCGHSSPSPSNSLKDSTKESSAYTASQKVVSLKQIPFLVVEGNDVNPCLCLEDSSGVVHLTFVDKDRNLYHSRLDASANPKLFRRRGA